MYLDADTKGNISAGFEVRWGIPGHWMPYFEAALKAGKNVTLGFHDTERGEPWFRDSWDWGQPVPNYSPLDQKHYGNLLNKHTYGKDPREQDPD